ncbi:unnamed protein product [Kuraishia capsulata CBS 1993]|uniref:nicotinamidase n=1 Tax=Kuraishia capsulata CBS 1993 TaxID=1382522 RepID=W6MGS7_9ASCO|nr:uncharacterized protein KUCA_T00001353001 [Kuraishia capsulata CBS 1993]CDK25384.1 unnamed protein product [Kuraishia capsulata CBS 1993]
MAFNPALIVVDLQEDFLPPSGSLAVTDGRDIIPAILELTDLEKYNWKTIIATKDWHPQDHCSFASNNNVAPYSKVWFSHPLGEKDPITHEVKKRLETVWPDHCVQDSRGSEFPAEFQAQWDILEQSATSTHLVKKGYLKDREYYSAFEDVWKLHHTELEDILVSEKITHVFTVGLACDFCVVNTSIDSASLGFPTFSIKECSRSVYPDKQKETDELYEENNVKLISLNSDILKKVEKH